MFRTHLSPSLTSVLLLQLKYELLQRLLVRRAIKMIPVGSIASCLIRSKDFVLTLSVLPLYRFDDASRSESDENGEREDRERSKDDCESSTSDRCRCGNTKADCGRDLNDVVERVEVVCIFVLR